MAEWKDVTDCFSERERHYNGTYLEQSQVYDDKVELPMDIFFSGNPFEFLDIF